MPLWKKMMLARLANYQNQATDGTAVGESSGGATTASESTVADPVVETQVKEPVAAPKISDSEAKLLKENMKLKEKIKAAEDSIKRFDGIDPDSVRALLAKKQEEETASLEAKGDYERIKAQMIEQHKAALSEKEAAISQKDSALAALQNQIAELTVGSAFAQSSFIKDDLTLTPSKTRVIYGSHFEFKDGVVVGYDKPAGAAERTVLVGASGEPLGFEDAMKKIIESDPEKDQLLRSKIKGGAGSNTTAKPVSVDTSKAISGLDKIKSGLAGLTAQKNKR